MMNEKFKKMKVVILAGGLGTRLREETEFKPKTMVLIGRQPMLWHIMKIYSSYGFKDFVICLGYKGESIKEYFLNYRNMTSDLTIKLGAKPRVSYLDQGKQNDWTVTLVDTGPQSQTGARLKAIEPYINGEDFMVTYSDGLANINIRKLVDFHLAHGKLATVTGVRPPSRFGELLTQGNQAQTFNEKPSVSQGYINGGFFVMKRGIFRYLSSDPSLALEQQPLSRLAADGQLMVFRHDQFWQCMDTYRDMQLLQQSWTSPNPPWKIWDN